MGYTEHLKNIIRKSTFTIQKRNGWISPDGTYKPINSHHYVEKALEILKHLNLDYD